MSLCLAPDLTISILSQDDRGSVQVSCHSPQSRHVLHSCVPGSRAAQRCQPNHSSARRPRWVEWQPRVNCFRFLRRSWQQSGSAIASRETYVTLAYVTTSVIECDVTACTRATDDKVEFVSEFLYVPDCTVVTADNVQPLLCQDG